MPIHFLCPACRITLCVNDDRAGDELACHKCGQPLIVPKPRKVPMLGILIDDIDDTSKPLDRQATIDETSQETMSEIFALAARLPEQKDWREEMNVLPHTKNTPDLPKDEFLKYQDEDEPDDHEKVDVHKNEEDLYLATKIKLRQSRQAHRALIIGRLFWAGNAAMFILFLVLAARFRTENILAYYICLSGVISIVVLSTISLIFVLLRSMRRS